MLPYDDLTGKPVTAPVGTLTWGRGFNLMAIGSPALFDVIQRFLLERIADQIIAFGGYSTLDEPRQSVLLDVAYNEGVAGLAGFHRMLNAVRSGDWQTAHDELLASKAATQLPGRYATLAQILLTGVIP